MIVLGIIILILIIILLLPVGADAAYIAGAFSLRVKAGPFRFGIVPGKNKGEKKAKKPKKPKKAKKQKKSDAAESGNAKGKKPKLSFGEIMEIVKLALRTLGRFRRKISVDKLMIHVVTAGPDPYDAVMNYGYINAALGAALPLLHRCFKIKREDYDSRIDFEADRLKIDLQAVLSIRIGEILLVAICALAGFLRWYLRRRRKAKAEAKAAAKEKITENSSAEKGI